MKASSASGLWPMRISAIRSSSMSRSDRWCDWQLGLTEAEREIPGPDRPNDRVAIAGRVDLDPRAAEMHGLVRVVGRDLDERDRRGIVEGPVVAGVRHLDGVERHALAANDPDAPERVLHAEPVARRVVEDEERFPVAHHLPDVLGEVLPRELHAVKEEQVRRG